MSLVTTSESEIDAVALEWETDFPGNSKTLITQRRDLAFADCHRTQIRNSLQSFQNAIRATGITDHYWKIGDRKHFDLLQKQHMRAQKEFDRLLAILITAAKPAAKKSEKEEPAPPQPLPIILPTMYQIVNITVIDGVVVTSAERDAEHFLTKSLWPTIAKFRRQMHFTGGIVPDLYAWTLTNKGTTWPDAEFVTIDYLPAEFERICEIEIKSGHYHLIDGQRLAYLREPLAPVESK